MQTIKIILAIFLPLATCLAGAQGMPLPLQEANTSTLNDWAKAAPILRAAIECRAPLDANKSVLTVFRLTNETLDGEHSFPAGLTVFGSLTANGISIFQGTEAEGSSYTIRPAGVSLAKVVKAAALKKDGPRYVRKVKGGVIEASEPRPGEVQIACIRGGDAE